jgi:hypothetical protein
MYYYMVLVLLKFKRLFFAFWCYQHPLTQY